MEKVDENLYRERGKEECMEPRGASWFKSTSVSAYFPVFSLSEYLCLPPSEVAQLNFCSLSQKKSLYFLLLTQTHGPLCLPYVKDILGILEIPCKYSLNPERRKKVAENEKLGCM